LPVLRRRHARDHARCRRLGRTGRVGAQYPRGSPRPSSRPASIRKEAHRVQPEPGLRATPSLRGSSTGVARVGWLNRMTQFKEKAGKDREGGLGRSLRLSGADGGRYSAVSRHPCAGRRGPEAASGTGPRTFAQESSTMISAIRSAVTASTTALLFSAAGALDHRPWRRG